MKLGIQTAGYAHAVILGDGNRLVWADIGNDLAEMLPIAFQNLLEELGVTNSDVTEIRVCLGPGGFTALRSGLAYAQGLAFGFNIPVTTTTLFHLCHTNEGELLGFAQGERDIIEAVPHKDGFLKEPHLRAQKESQARRINEDENLHPRAFFQSQALTLPIKPLYVRPPDAIAPALPPWLTQT
ncbi:MAG: hypothetical protein ACPGJH_08045 [Alphaproteobacteria bacterium]